MADGLNRCILLGNLGADPELKVTTGGQAVLKMRLATTESYVDRNKTRQERTEWHSVVLWGKRAEGLAKFLSKGMRLLVEGRIQTSSYDGKDGTKKYKTEINATNVVLCGDRGGKGGDAGSPPDDSDDNQAPSGGAGGGDDDIPFLPRREP